MKSVTVSPKGINYDYETMEHDDSLAVELQATVHTHMRKEMVELALVKLNEELAIIQEEMKTKIDIQL